MARHDREPGKVIPGTSIFPHYGMVQTLLPASEPSPESSATQDLKIIGFAMRFLPPCWGFFGGKRRSGCLAAFDIRHSSFVIEH
ncbi:MAG: hypothetical protein WBF17_16740 [Phycisphaerae bacterium]